MSSGSLFIWCTLSCDKRKGIAAVRFLSQCFYILGLTLFFPVYHFDFFCAQARAFIFSSFSLLALRVSLSLPVLKIEQIASSMTLTLSPQICLFINFITIYSYNLEKFPFLTVYVYGSMYLALNVRGII